jgi:TonB family protein
MGNSTEFGKNWEGRVVDEKFPLRQWLGGSDHTAVFLTERAGAAPQKAVIKLIRAGRASGSGSDSDSESNEDAQLSRWTAAAKLSHPHLIRLFESGRFAIDGARLLYVVMEFAEENLAEILPLRALSPAEVSEMLRPTAEALAYLHDSGFAHGSIRPSNIMAVADQVKISTDSLRKIGERDSREPTPYDAPEVATTGVSPAADMWSLGATLVAIMTQQEMRIDSQGGWARIPYKIPQPFYGIAQLCLRFDPRERCTAGDILSQSQKQTFQTQPPVDAKAVEQHVSQRRPKQWIVIAVVVAALLLVAWVGKNFMAHPPSVPAAESHSASSTAPAETSAAQPPAPFSEDKKPAQTGTVRGSVLQQVQPDVSRSAQNTIDGHIKVIIHVSVDASGNVSQAKFVSAGPSKYFSERALEAARRWKFNPPQIDGQPAASEWTLRFQFGRAGTQVFPAENKP